MQTDLLIVPSQFVSSLTNSALLFDFSFATETFICMSHLNSDQFPK